MTIFWGCIMLFVKDGIDIVSIQKTKRYEYGCSVLDHVGSIELVQNNAFVEETVNKYK